MPEKKFPVIRDVDGVTLETFELLIDAMRYIQKLARQGIAAHVVYP